ncbi:hypothetical protein EfmAA610_05580 [Enterococcus faecium]|nr:hypothetical protein EfmAA610_05580 [Enterococcus faecium]
MPHEWRRYRENIIAESGISIFVFGNKLESGEIVTADGMIEEFELSVQNELKDFPIGFTKGASKVLFDKIQENFSDYFDDSLKSKFQALEKLDTEGEVDKKVEQIVSLINSIQED